MDDPNQRRRYDQAPSANRPTYGNDQNRSAVSDRMQSSQMNIRSSRPSDGYQGYYGEPTQQPFGNPYQQSSYTDPSRQQYGSSMMYGGPQVGYPSGQQQQQQQPYQPNRDMTMMSGSSYFQPDPSTGGAPVEAVYQQQPLPQYPSGLQQIPAISQQTQSGPVGGETAVNEPEDNPNSEPTALSDQEVDERMGVFRAKLTAAVKAINRAQLSVALDYLLEVNTWIQEQTVPLALHLDNQDRRSERLAMWNDFNHTWLALLQKQKDFLNETATPVPGHPPLSLEQLKACGNSIVKLGELMEPHALVDYQYGVWEDQITLSGFLLSCGLLIGMLRRI
ncbi:hypothetical protein Cpir12675_001944 [Ceratocystis pirilliformis]|uniref:Uncharacterized protein n=1 Tax=Ceratocystis pirilliformis TaxID=259994 RepID=A0ABR3ZFS5_9PEZI